MDFQTILSAANELEVSDRLRLIDALASSVPDDQPPQLPDEWLGEVQRRSSEIDSGEVACEQWGDIRARLFAKHGVSSGD